MNVALLFAAFILEVRRLHQSASGTTVNGVILELRMVTQDCQWHYRFTAFIDEVRKFTQKCKRHSLFTAFINELNGYTKCKWHSRSRHHILHDFPCT